MIKKIEIREPIRKFPITVDEMRKVIESSGAPGHAQLRISVPITDTPSEVVLTWKEIIDEGS